MGILVYYYLLQAATNASVRLSRAQHSPSPPMNAQHNHCELGLLAEKAIPVPSTSRGHHYLRPECMLLVVCSARSKLA